MSEDEKKNFKKEIFEEFEKKNKSKWHKHPLASMKIISVQRIFLSKVVWNTRNLYQSLKTIIRLCWKRAEIMLLNQSNLASVGEIMGK